MVEISRFRVGVWIESDEEVEEHAFESSFMKVYVKSLSSKLRGL